ncbi:MAG TPA: AAA family ATPase, partial [Candidatus Lokiarchaeia archaeon]|nr:AAA family ATPase [Candidatus Lokiarchaeia archaeon]
MITLNRIIIQGYKSISNLDLQLSSVNILIGINGSGKSNFISTFTLLNHLVEKNLQAFIGKMGGADNLLFFGRKVTDEIFLKLVFGQNAYEVKLTPTSEDSLIFESEICTYQDRHHETPFNLILGSGHKETKLYSEIKQRQQKGMKKGVADYVLEKMLEWKVFHFHDTSENAKIKQSCDINDNTKLRPDASNIAAFLFMLQNKYPENYNKIVSTVQLAAPFFDDFSLHESALNSEKILLEWREKGSDKYFNAHALSDGTLRFICLTTLLLQPELPSLIVIDEPELGLHPYAIRLLGELLQSAGNQTQVILATQSVTLVDQFTADNVILVNKMEKHSSFERVNSEAIAEWLQDYSLGELWEKNVLGIRGDNE